MPEQLCTQCETELISAYLFRKRCENALSRLLHFIRGDAVTDSNNVEKSMVEQGCSGVKDRTCSTAAAAKVQNVIFNDDLNNAEIWIATDEVNLPEMNANNQIDGLAFSGSEGTVIGAVKTTANEIKYSPTPARKMHKCKECSKEFSRATHLKRHMMIHSDDRPFTCTKCDKSFRRADHLQAHQNSHAEVKPHECDNCSRRFTRAEHLRNHIWTQHTEAANATELSREKFICTICDRTFATSKCLRAHSKTHSERSIECKICGETFVSRQMLSEHGKTHGNEKQFLCSECGMTFVRNDYLVVHMRRHNGEKPYKCNYCGKGFPRATDLKVHERYHTGEKRHLCTMCGKGFQRAYNLIVHMRVHTGERPYQCSQCSKSFAQGNDLKAHFRRHTGERYRCDFCSEGFIQGYHLTQHKQSVHGIDMLAHMRRVEKIPSKPTVKHRNKCDDINRTWTENAVVANGD